MRKFHITFTLALAAALNFAFADEPTLQRTNPAPVAIYDNDPNHLWNRVHSELLVQPMEAKAAGRDLLDPLFKWQENPLRDADTSAKAVALLGEFVKADAASMSPLQRAVMQRDLLAVFHWLAGSEFDLRAAWSGPERKLSVALARAIHHVALTAEEIRKLPDNYASAVAAPDAVTTFDLAHPAPYLPKDLLADGGPWISLRGVYDLMVAKFHFRFFAGRSVFDVRMRHPEGRAAGEAYLKELADLKIPWVSEKPVKPKAVPSLEGMWANPATPQFPPGTAWALVRRAVLADANGMPVASPLVESVQIRVYRNLGWAADPETAEVLGEEQSQIFFEWESRRTQMLGKGGFHLTTPDDQRYAFFGRTERPGATSLNCFQCHSAVGIHSVAIRSRILNEILAIPPTFRATNRDAVDSITASRARALPGWTLLHWLWEESPKK